jgi:hypothetical protein
MVYFYHGSLPWQSLKASTDDKRDELIKEKKMDTLIEDLCYDLPDAFANYLNYVRALGYDEQPNYSYLRKLFRDLFSLNVYLNGKPYMCIVQLPSRRIVVS